MPLIATEGLRYSNTVKHEYAPELAFCREQVIVNESAQTLAIGTVLGQVTATGKWKIVTAGATDGSQVAAAVVVEEIAVPAATDTKVLALVRGPAIVSKGALTMGADIDTAGEKNAVYAALATKGILANDSF